ncbi:helix-turn-helix domain-containing protein [Streptomyces flaveus]|uniref:helix-turn-helix domain-containing protein n=1 Tax=Streptomyces flaveus TaxID=66370 RepID=UPI00331C65CE
MGGSREAQQRGDHCRYERPCANPCPRHVDTSCSRGIPSQQGAPSFTNWENRPPVSIIKNRQKEKILHAVVAHSGIEDRTRGRTAADSGRSGSRSAIRHSPARPGPDRGPDGSRLSTATVSLFSRARCAGLDRQEAVRPPLRETGLPLGCRPPRARGERIGRPPAMTEEQIRHARALLAQPENTITSIAKLLGVSRTTLYKYVPELTAGRDSLVPSGRSPELPGPR